MTENFRAVRIGKVLLTLALVLMFTASAHAHKVNVFAYAEDGRVHAECYFVDGSKCTGSKITVEDSAGKVVAEGVTDKDGMYVFDIPKVDDLKVVLHAGMGHMNDYTLGKAEVGAAYNGQQADAPGKAAGGLEPGNKEKGAVGEGQGPAAREQAPKEHPADVAPAEKMPAAQPACADPEEVRAIVDEVVEERLKPVYRVLSDIRKESEKPSLTETISGIGYIMGLMGIYLYLKSRKRR